MVSMRSPLCILRSSTHPLLLAPLAPRAALRVSPLRLRLRRGIVHVFVATASDVSFPFFPFPFLCFSRDSQIPSKDGRRFGLITHYREPSQFLIAAPRPSPHLPRHTSNYRRTVIAMDIRPATARFLWLRGGCVKRSYLKRRWARCACSWAGRAMEGEGGRGNGEGGMANGFGRVISVVYR